MITTRRLTGRPSWPILLLAGAEKSGKTYAAVKASTSAHVGRTLWVGIGEDDPDEYGQIPGERVELVEHNGTYRGVLNALRSAVREPWVDGKPNLIVGDSSTRLWSLLTDMAQAEANRRRRKVDEAEISPDLWNVAKSRWQHILDCFRDHQGPSIITARLEVITLFEEGQPTADRAYKVQAEKGLPYDVGGTIELRARGEAYLTGMRSMRLDVPHGTHLQLEDFTVENLWERLGLTDGGAGTRTYARTDADTSTTVEAGLEHDPDALRRLIVDAAKAKGLQPADVAGAWKVRNGHPIQQATNAELLRAELDRVLSLPDPEKAEADQ